MREKSADQELAEAERLFRAETQKRLNKDPSEGLLVAASFGFIPEMTEAVARGANLNFVHPQTHETPLSAAVMTGSLATVDWLLAAGTSPDAQPSSRSPLVCACMSGVDCARRLVEAGADIHWRSKDGMTPLMVAAAFRNLPVLELLLEAGADPSARNAAGQNALELFENLNSLTGGIPFQIHGESPEDQQRRLAEADRRKQEMHVRLKTLCKRDE
jgi:ankyrin repeat protein